MKPYIHKTAPTNVQQNTHINKYITKKKQKIDKALLEQRKLARWSANATNKKKVAHITRQWRKQANLVKTQVTNLVVKAYAFTDGIGRANVMLNNGLRIQAAVDFKESTALVDKIFKIELVSLYITNTAFTPHQKQQIIESLINSEFAIKPVAPKLPVNSKLVAPTAAPNPAKLKAYLERLAK